VAINSFQLPQHLPFHVWFKQWIQQGASPSETGVSRRQGLTGLEKADALFKSLASPFTAESLSETGSGKAPTPTERMAFLKFLQLQMEEAHKNGKPFRVDVDANTSVVLSLKPDGVSATFLIKEAPAEKIKQVQQQLNALHASLHARQLPVKALLAEGESQSPKLLPLIEAVQADRKHSDSKKSKQHAKSKKASK